MEHGASRSISLPLMGAVETHSSNSAILGINTHSFNYEVLLAHPRELTTFAHSSLIMKKFGFSRKGDDGDEDSTRAALFSRSSKKSSPAPASSNPYAQPPQAADPYAQDTNKYANMGPIGPSGPSPYQSARQNYGLAGGSGPGREDFQRGPGPNRGPPSGPPKGSPVPAYGRAPASNGSGYGAEKYGSGGGYGASRYDGLAADTGSKYGPGGYGGLGRTNSNDTTTTEDMRDALFGGAKDRVAQGSAMPPSNGRPGGGYSAESDSGGYAAYGEERQLTAEEEEEEDVQATKQQIRFMKQEDVSSTRNALRIAQEAEETGRATLARLGAQGERIHNTEKNLDLASNHNRIAEEKAKELRTLNKSMFAVHVSNPFTSAQRKAARDQEIIDKHQADREQRDATRKAAFGSQQRMERAFKDIQPGDVGYRAPQNKVNLAERSKYQFEADSEDDEMENEIDSNLDALGHAAGRLNALARATGREVDDQNTHIDRIIQKVCVQFAISVLVYMLIFPIERPGRRPNRHEQSKIGPHPLRTFEGLVDTGGYKCSHQSLSELTSRALVFLFGPTGSIICSSFLLDLDNRS